MYRILFLLILFVRATLELSAQEPLQIVRQELLFSNAPFQECHASSMVETDAGKLLVSFFGGSQEGKNDVNIWMCSLENGSISKPEVVADGVMHDALRYPTWNPVLFKLKSGRIFLFYKVGPNPREWWGMVKTSDDNGDSWSVAKKLPKGILGPIKNKPIALSNGDILAPSSIEETEHRWKAHIELSADQGETWQYIPIDSTSSFNVIQPSILHYGEDKLQVLCRSREGNVMQAWSADGGKTWGPLTRTILLNPNSGTDALTLKDGRQLIVYNPDTPGKEWFNNRGKLHIACSLDGEHWKDVAVLENGTKEEYSYPSIIQTADNLIHVTYTYDRKNIKHVVLK